MRPASHKPGFFRDGPIQVEISHESIEIALGEMCMVPLEIACPRIYIRFCGNRPYQTHFMLHLVEAGIKQRACDGLGPLDEFSLSRSYLIRQRTAFRKNVSNPALNGGDLVVEILNRKPAVLYDVMI